MKAALIFLGTAALTLLASTTFGAVMVTDKIMRFAGAIAFAEGYWTRAGMILTGNRPAKNNNPGDFLGDGDVGSEGGYAKYSTPQKGWDRLYAQLKLIVAGASAYYNLDMSISDFAYVYTTTEQDAWSENVASFLNVSRDTPIRGLLT